MNMEKSVNESKAEQVFIVRAPHINGYGRLFGGQLMQWIDELAGIVCRRHSEMGVTTAAIDNLNFKDAAYQNDMIVLKGKLIKGMANVPELTDGLGKFIVFGIIVSIGMSLGGLTGYAINPARDLGPRLAHAVLPIKGKGSSNWGYGIVTLIGPVIGAVAAVLLFGAIPW